MTQTIKHRVVVPVAPERAFDAFVRELREWWPQEYTWAGDALETIAIEPHDGGRCFEIGPHDFHCDWGRVVAWEPPHRLAFTWQISPRREPVPDPAQASEIEVRVQPDGDSGTAVELEHRGIERHGDGAEDYGAAMGSEMGWPYILGRFTDYLGATPRA
jgi:uncharacterized protein YndB with AHSA1/START domain